MPDNFSLRVHVYSRRRETESQRGLDCEAWPVCPAFSAREEICQNRFWDTCAGSTRTGSGPG